MKLTLSEIRNVIERRYRLDEPVIVELRNDKRVSAYEFITITRTYEYGETEHEYLVRGRMLTKDGRPNERKDAGDYTLYAPSGPHAELMPDPRKPFIDALWEATER